MPGQAGGGSFQKEKNYIAQKEFAYRMCARRPTSAMPKSFLWCERAFCCSMVVMFCALKWSVLMSWCLLRGQVMWWSRHLMRCNGLCCVMSRDAMRCHGDELYYSSTTLYYKVLLQYYSVLQILLCTTSTTLYYKVLLQYYSVLPCTTKYYSSTNLYTTKYYSSTNLYYKVQLQYYPVLQSTTPILLRTTNTTLYYSSTTLYYKVPLKYYSVLLQYYLVLQSTTPVLPRTTKYFMIDPHHIWNVIYNARSNKRQPPTSANTSPATQNESHDWSASHMKRHLQCAEQQASPSNFSKYCACHAKWISWLTIHITYETSFTMRGATVNTLHPHQILRLPRKMNVMIDPHRIWNLIYTAGSNKHQPPTSPNTAPATQHESHDWSASHMKRHFQCAEQQASPSNLTKGCACHAKWISWFIRVTYETSFTMRGATGITFQPHQILRLPRKMNVMIDPHRIWNLIYNAGSNKHQPHQILRLPRKMNLMIDPHHIWNVIYNAGCNKHQPPTSPNTAHATQNECHDWATSHMKRHLQCAEQQASPSNLTKYAPATQNEHPRSDRNLLKTVEVAFPMRDRSETVPRMIREWSDPENANRNPPRRQGYFSHWSRFYWKLKRFPLRLSFQISPHAAPATKSDTWTAPNAAPATKSDTWTSPNAAPATKSDTWTSPNAAPATKSGTWTSPNAAPATKSETWTSPNAAPATKSDTWTSPNAAPATKSDTWTSPTTTTTTTTTTIPYYYYYYYYGLLLLGLKLLLLLLLGLPLLGLRLLGLLLLGLLLLGLLLLGLVLLGLLLLGLLLLGLPLLGLRLLGLLLLGLLLLGLLLLGLLLLLLGLLLRLGLLLLGLLLLGLLLLGLLLLGLLLLGLLLLRLLLLGLLFLSGYPKVRISEVCH